MEPMKIATILDNKYLATFHATNLSHLSKDRIHWRLQSPYTVVSILINKKDYVRFYLDTDGRCLLSELTTVDFGQQKTVKKEFAECLMLLEAR